MMTNLTNQLTISQETDKDAISYGVSMAVNDFFTLTERRKEKEERERITEALIKIVKKQFGDLTLEDVREGIENGCSEAYGEISNFDEAIRLIPRFLRAYRKELQSKSTSTKSTVSQQEQQKDLIKKGKLFSWTIFYFSLKAKLVSSNSRKAKLVLSFAESLLMLLLIT